MASKFDFIIVGGGTAGLVLAARLTAHTNVQVLVIEAGEDLTADPRVNVPAMWSQLQGTDADWKLKTVPQIALGNREQLVPQGKLLGGSGALKWNELCCSYCKGGGQWLGAAWQPGLGLGEFLQVSQEDIHAYGRFQD
ncbi:hypothetical protein VTI74DRAFT_10402 [Chaetomium olivicolor]